MVKKGQQFLTKSSQLNIGYIFAEIPYKLRDFGFFYYKRKEKTYEMPTTIRVGEATALPPS